MTPCTCLVVSPRVDDAVARAAGAALSRKPEFNCSQLCGDAVEGAVPDADVIVYCMGENQHCDALRQWTAESPHRAVLVIATAPDEAKIAACLDARVSDFLVAPLNPEELVVRVKRAVGLERGSARTSASVAPLPHIDGLIGKTPAFTKQLARLLKMAICDAGVLITGETGTGKEVFAQAIHYQSARASRPWVAVNCAAIPVELMESELFGHARGAYTNAHAARPGLVCEAEGGTLFLDEIDCISYGAQAKLLRFLEEKEFRRIGSNVVHHADVRIIAASNENLETLVLKGAFRQDLYFRLNVLPLTLPPLRERLDDIPDLALHFVMRFARQFGRRIEGLTPMALRRLHGHAWPGNVRELAHTIERAGLMCEGRVLGVEDFDLGASDVVADNSFRAAKSRVVDEFERSYIERLLAAHDGNVTHAAQAAKKNRRAFFELIRKHQITAERFRSRP